MASYLPIHNPPKYYIFTYIYKVYLWIYILHTNVLAIKPTHHFVKQYDIKCIWNVSLNFHEFFGQCV
jgi:hypothetical protein